MVQRNSQSVIVCYMQQFFMPRRSPATRKRFSIHCGGQATLIINGLRNYANPGALVITLHLPGVIKTSLKANRRQVKQAKNVSQDWDDEETACSERVQPKNRWFCSNSITSLRVQAAGGK